MTRSQQRAGAMALKLRARREEDKQERRRAILAAAEGLVVQRGVQTLTMSEVGERAGVAKATLYLYFQTREELLLALLQERLEGWFVQLDAGLDARGGAWSASALASLL